MADDRKGRANPTEYILTRYRGLFVTLFLLPISVSYGLYFTFLQKLSFFLGSAPRKHNKRVQKIVRQVMRWKEEGAKEKLCTSRSPWLSMSELVPGYKKDRTNIQVNLQDILEIDTEKRTVRVEPRVNMGQITALLLPLGWTLPVVPELDDLTVGGLIMGFGIESSSHKYGLFQYICKSYEIVTPEGKVLRCSKEENPEFFYNIPWSHGTLGILVSAELGIIPAKKYVRITYHALHSAEEIVHKFERESRSTLQNDFVECIQYSRDKAVLMTGELADEPNDGSIVNRIGRWYKPWFYTHCETMLGQSGPIIEYIPIRDYYHRHTRSLFWEMKDILPIGNHPIFRYLMGWALPPHVALLKYFETETIKDLREQRHVVQDMLMPISKLRDSLVYFDTHYSVYPLWLSPMCIYTNELGAGFVHPCMQGLQSDALFVDIGAYGTPSIKDFDGNTALKNLERFVLDNGGYQALYARTLLSRSEFRQMFDHSSYDKLREQYPLNNQAFGEVYDKVSGRIAPTELRKRQGAVS
jgi:delta24-sterol reductase